MFVGLCLWDDLCCVCGCGRGLGCVCGCGIGLGFVTILEFLGFWNFSWWFVWVDLWYAVYILGLLASGRGLRF